GVLRAVTFIPRSSSRGVDKPGEIRMRRQIRGNPLLGELRAKAIAKDAAGDERTVTGLNAPSLNPIAAAIQDDVAGPGISRPIRMNPAQPGEIGGRHHVLVNVIATGEHTQFIQSFQAIRRLLVAPKDPLDTGGLHLAHDLDRITVPAPNVDGADQPINAWIDLLLLGEGLEQAGFFGISAVTFGHGNMPAV